MLNELPEGKYILDEKADDLAGNTTERTTDFTIDRSPPVVTISSPLNGKYYGADKDAVSITGSITETNLDSYTIRYGTGDNPSTWNELSSGQSVPTDQRFFLWNVGKSSGLPDGLYTVSVLARDKAGLTGEARVKVTVDNTVPQVAITSPQDGSYATAPTNINGTAYDGNLDKYTLELAEGQCSAAAKWSVMQASSSSVSNGLIASWLAPPPDGYYCFRLTAVDMLGQTGQTTTNVKVDTHPPAAPALSGDIENKSTARLTWTQNSEADLSGYNFYRNSVKVNGSPLSDLGYVDQNLEEGTYTYTVKAVDRAGNESASSNQVTLKVDVTGPDTRIDLPKDGSSVSGIVDIKGTAYSSDDFRQYRVYAGQGQAPAQWSLVRTSPVPIQYGTLTQWDTTGLKGQYSIKLEAEDLTGNVNSNQITVTVDDTPPAAPVLLSATANGSDVTIRWQANSEADLADYLLFRNDQPANGDSLAISDLRPYLLTGTTYVDKSLPDGTYRYFLIAMDQAGNMSDQSNVIEVNIDTHPPHATIVEPSDGKKFDSRTLIKAESPDLDIASVRFEYKKNSETVWNVIATVTQPPYITYIDPSALGLTYGDYQIRAVALDKGGKTDPSPSYSTLTYADLAAPQAPADLVAQTNGSDVTLSWSPSAETDLSGYNVYRISGSTKTKINTSIIKEATYKDSGLPDGQYSYEVTASDTAGNESRPSNTVSAQIYAPVLMQPYTPTDQEKIAVTGSADPNATVEIYVDSDGGSELRGTVAADSSGNFGSDVTLSIGENRITVTAKDTGGNTSRPSEELEVTYGKAPATPTGLTAAFQDRNVTLTWNSNSESDLVGYNLYLNGTKVNRPLAITAGDLTASTSNSIHYASSAFDSNPSTYWLSTYSRGVFIPQCVEIDLPSPELISHIEIRWIYNSYAGKDFEIQAWTGYAWLALRKVTGNSKIQNFFDLTPSYRTDRIRIYITDVNSTSTYKYVGMSEVEIQKDNLITVTSYNDTDLQNGVYKYRLTAVDYYGFESPSSAEVGSSVGDLVPPAPPQNLSAIASGSNVELSWSENSEPDLAGYNVYRVTPNGFVKLNSSLLVSPTYTDVGLANGTYTYTVTAIDTANNESQHSTEASAAVHVVLPPPGSLAVAALQGGGSLQISWEYAGLPDLGFTLYRGTSPGGPYDKGTNTGALSYIDSGLTNGTAYYYVVTAVDGLGNESAYSNEASGIPSYAISWTDPEIYFPTISGKPLVLFEDKTDVDGEADPAYPVELYRNGVLVGSTMPNDKNVVRSFPLPSTAAVFVSPDGGKVFYSYDGSLWLENLASGDSKRTTLTNISSVAWSPDGKKIAYLYYDYYHHSRIGVYDIDEDVSSDLTEDLSVTEQYPSWSSDGSKIAYVSDKGGHYNLWLKDISTGTFTQLTSGLYPSAPSLSPDGTKIAYAFNLVPYLLDVKTGSTIQIGASSDNKTFSWSLDGKRILFMGGTENNYYNLFVFDTSTNSTTQITDTPDYKYWPLWCPDGKSVLYEVRDTNSYSIVIAYLDNEEHDIHLISGLPYCYITRTRSGAITCSLNDNLLDFFYPKGYFSFNDSRLGTGDNTFEVVSSDASGSERKSPQISVLFDNSQTPDMSVRENDIFVSPAFPQPGQGVTVNVGVRNTGVVDLNDVDVDVYLLDPDGNVQPLKSETIPMIAAGSEELIVLDWGGSPVPGKYTIMAVADPTNSIEESDETNNVATKDIFVVTGDKIIMTTTSGSDKYHSDRPVNIDINLVNPGIEKTVTITTSIEDTQRNVVSPLDTRSIDLPYGVQDVPLTWNTGTTMAGDYVIHVVLADDSGALFENTVPFSIMPNLAIDSTLTTDKADYEPNEDVNLNVNIKNAGDNYIIPETVVREKIIGPDGNVPYSEDKSPSNLLPGAEAKIDWKWSTGDSAPGSYKAAADVYIDGQLISTAEAPFTIKPTVTITGTLDISPAKVEMGKDITADYSVSNEGNVDVAGLGLGVLIVDLQSGQTIDSQDATVDLAMGASKDGAVVFSTADYELKPYSVVLRYTYNGQSKTLASQTVTIIDEEPPSVNITSPVAGFFNSTITLAATVTDNLSGVAVAEYEMDDGPWQPLQPQDIAHGGYSVTWEPVKADEGVHVIGFRATDTAGNTSQPVTISITVDLTPPAPPVVVSPDDNTTLFTETVDIHGTAEPGSEVVMRGTDTVRTKADTATGDFVFSAVHLLPGDNSFALTAEDAAGNVSTSYNYGLFFDISDWFTGTVKSEPDPVYQGRDETITYSISNGGDDVSGLTVTTIIFDPDTQGVKKSFEDSIDVAANTSVTGRVVASTEDLSPKVYGIKVEISSPNMKQAKKLAEALFEVKPALEVKATLPDRERVLLWLNYACFARDDHAECPDETLIEQSLVDAGIEFNVVYDKKDFESELRNPYYTDIIVLGNHSPIEDHFSEEVFGMKRTGVLPDRDYSIELPQSEISDGGTIVSHGKLLRIEARDPDEVIGWIVGGSDNQTEDYPGIVRHRYGKGKVLYYAFDLGISASYDPFRKLLDNSVQYVHRTADSGDARVFGPDQLVPAEINVKSLGDTFDLRITTSYPDTFRLFYPLEGLWVADNPWTVNMTLDPDQAGSLNYYALSPDKAGSYLFKTEVGYIDAEGSYNFYQDIEKEVRIEKETAFLYDGIITSLSALPLSGQERAKADGVISYMENVRERPVKSVDDIEKNISDLVRAKDSLLSIKGFDISGIRLSIDEILKSWESRYYYGTGGEKRKD
ncbi:MAG: Ig-like domain-containing protein [Candidatus Sulfobium sp.]